jgi:hypothetical membrane protein
MRNKLFFLCGMLAPVVYIATVIIGGIRRPGYNHISQFVSELIEMGAPNKWLLNPLFALYNLLTMAFGIGLFMKVRNMSQGKGKVSGLLGALVLVAEGICGFLTVFFPQDPRGAPVTSTGIMHLVLAGLSSLTTILSMALMGFWFRTISRLRGYGIYSFVSAIVVFISGGAAAYTGATLSPILGLMERITIGGFLQWLFVIAAKLYLLEAPETSQKMRPRLRLLTWTKAHYHDWRAKAIPVRWPALLQRGGPAGNQAR